MVSSSFRAPFCKQDITLNRKIYDEKIALHIKWNELSSVSSHTKFKNKFLAVNQFWHFSRNHRGWQFPPNAVQKCDLKNVSRAPLQKTPSQKESFELQRRFNPPTYRTGTCFGCCICSWSDFHVRQSTRTSPARGLSVFHGLFSTDHFNLRNYYYALHFMCGCCFCFCVLGSVCLVLRFTAQVLEALMLPGFLRQLLLGIYIAILFLSVPFMVQCLFPPDIFGCQCRSGASIHFRKCGIVVRGVLCLVSRVLANVAHLRREM